MDKISRYRIADYINITPNTAKETYSFMGKGFNSLNENPGAQMDEKTYICDTTSTSSVKGYKTQFPYDCDVIKDQITAMYLYNIGRNHAVGVDAESDYIKVDLYDPCIVGSTRYFKARKFRVCIEVSGAAGAGGETMVSTGNLNTVGDPIFGYFDTTTKTFTLGDYVESLGVLKVTSSAGSSAGTTKITLESALTLGNTYMYKTASTLTEPTLDADCTAYSVWNGTSDITAVNGNQICIVEVNSAYLAKKSGVQTVTAKA